MLYNKASCQDDVDTPPGVMSASTKLKYEAIQRVRGHI